MVQRAVYFNDALIAEQKQRVDYEAALAALQSAVRNGEDLGQYMSIVSDVAGKELLLNSLGLRRRTLQPNPTSRKTCSMPAPNSKPCNRISARATPR